MDPITTGPHRHTIQVGRRSVFVVRPGVARGAVVDRKVDQSQVAATIGKFMGFQTEFAERQVLEEAFA